MDVGITQSGSTADSTHIKSSQRLKELETIYNQYVIQKLFRSV